MPVIPATPESDTGGSLKPRNSRPAWATKQDPDSKKKKKSHLKLSTAASLLVDEEYYEKLMHTLRKCSRKDTIIINSILLEYQKQSGC
jgi:hypothetical protein